MGRGRVAALGAPLIHDPETLLLEQELDDGVTRSSWHGKPRRLSPSHLQSPSPRPRRPPPPRLRPRRTRLLESADRDSVASNPRRSRFRRGVAVHRGARRPARPSPRRPGQAARAHDRRAGDHPRRARRPTRRAFRAPAASSPNEHRYAPRPTAPFTPDGRSVRIVRRTATDPRGVKRWTASTASPR